MNVYKLQALLGTVYAILLLLRFNYATVAFSGLLIILTGLFCKQYESLKFDKSAIHFIIASIFLALLCIFTTGGIGNYLISQLSYAIFTLIVVNVVGTNPKYFLLIRFFTYAIAGAFLLLWFSSLFNFEIVYLYMMLPHKEEPSFWDASGHILRLNELSITSVLLLRPRVLRNVLSAITLSIPAFSAPSILINVINLLKFKSYYIALILLSTILFILLYASNSELLEIYLEQKAISLNLRMERFPDICLFGGCGINSELNENLFVAIGQMSGLAASILYYIVFILFICATSKSVYFAAISTIILSANPFPIALIILYSTLWHYDQIKYRHCC